MNSKIVVSGNIISELSEKIPSNIIALNELLKNSYDAGAKKVIVEFDYNNKKLIIKDNGCGMNKQDIDVLFHISKSEKKYGSINKYNRYTQGSKGLGFLSVFKFGNRVIWKTNKNKGLLFEINYLDVVNIENISDYNVDIREIDNLSQGTEIEIELNDYSVKTLQEYFQNKKMMKKIINAFDDKDFELEVHIGDEIYSSKDNTSIKKVLPKRQMFYVKYNSNYERIEFYHKDKLIQSIKYPFNSKRYTLDIELIIYKLKPGDKSKINELFYNNQDELTPLIYINSNLFNNYEIFDPNIMKNIKTSNVLNQMIGYISIISDDEDINFNSDRTQFLQNELTDEILQFLKEINKKIQLIGSNYKDDFRDTNFLISNDFDKKRDKKDYIDDKFIFKDFVLINENETTIKYTFFDNTKIIEKTPLEETEQKVQPAVIILKAETLELDVNIGQIDLHGYVKEARDSSGNDIKDKLIISENGNIMSNGILPSVDEECIKLIKYSYNDAITNNISKTLQLFFKRKISAIKTSHKNIPLVHVDARKDYKINYNCYIDKILSQINKVNELGFDEYKEIIACSLRSLFDISIDELKKESKLKGKIKLNESDLADNVKNVINFIASDNKYITEIANSTSISFKDLKNILNSGDYYNAVKNAHLGAHHSTVNLSDMQIKDLGKKTGNFLVIINEIINNKKIL